MNAPATQSSGADTQQLISNISNTYSAIERGDWVNAGLGIANSAMGIVGMSSNPLSGFLSAGFSWAIQHVDFLREPFDVLLGSPESIAKMSESFQNAGKQVHSIANEYEKICVSQTREWAGKAADGYRAAAKRHAGGLETLAKSVEGIAGAVKGAGELVGTVRKMIMDLISQAVSDMVMKIIQWLAASFLTFGAAIAGAIADIVTTAVNYAKKLADFLQKLVGSVQKLMNLIKSVSQIAKVAEQVIDAISTMANGGKGGGGGSVRNTAGGFDGIRADDQSRASGGAGGTFTSGAGGGYAGGRPTAGDGLTNVRPGYQGGNTDGYQGPYGQGPGVGAGPAVRPVYTPPAAGNTGGGAGGGGGYVPPGSGSGGGTGAGTGRWVPGHWESGTTTTAGGEAGTRPPSIGTPPTTNDWYRPPATDSAAAAAGGGGAGGGAPKGGGGGGGGGGMPAGFGGGPAGGGGAGGTSATQFGGAAGVMAAGSGAAPAAPAAAGGAGGGAKGGAGMGGMMGGAPMAGGAGQQGGSNEHKRKVRIEGESLVEPPKAAKPVIGE
ncbi:hypothetical protein SAMN04488074_108331 [Lentzea albidocapillata subsp. violacea]|uniref:Outer membrane channel protein CpnT-like N-terminal domain-containing protein n=1 Tax=Lentzea albidocapillata subsp. violacea TaxID=128104 RepID=A0A1G9GVL7_9PSEU|nr:hypothetical protein [Lentzea albidocapillata]SDL04632.1 hypothetical protein SAMN04488074_108331 [Lentzea albidocapillata subsp. violacea]